jgi:hypothetical protein
MEFILEKEVKDIIPQAVGFNFDQLKQELEVSLGKYQNIVVTEDATKEAKADRAKLNALKDTIDGKRKEIKKEWNVPYIEFENKVKILIGMIDEPIQAIDKQVKAYERKLKDDKQAEIVAYFKEAVGDLANLVPYEKIHVEKWLNSSERMSAIKKEITAIIETIQNDIAVIKGLEMECEQQMLDKYLENFSIADAMKEKARWEDRIMKISEYERQQQIKEQQRESQRAAFDRVQNSAVDAETAEVIPGQMNIVDAAEWETEKSSVPDPEWEQQLQTLDFRVYVTPEQKKLLKAFLKDNNIRYGRVE